jgi:flagellar L-ring protein precursor FlgH
MKPLLLAAALTALAGCSTLRPTPPPADDGHLDLPPPVARKGQGGGVFSPATPWSLTSDSRAFRPGDLLTVVLEETTQASKSADTKLGKSSGVAIKPVTLFGKALPKTEMGVDASRDFNGTATSSQQNTLQGAITVVVFEVLPNGLLRVNGEKTLNLNQGEEFVRLSGYVRAGDIDTDNRVSSQRIANARIAYSGRGDFANSNEQGWLMHFFNSAWMPF